MKIVARLKTIEEFEILNQLGVDIFSLDTKFSTKRIGLFNLESIKRVSDLAKTYQKDIYLLINIMIHQNDILELTQFLQEIKKIKISGIVINDLTVYVLAKRIGLDGLIIYQPGTMNTDSYSAEYFRKKNIKGITISREITLQEIKEISNSHYDIELSLIGHGYLDMFYSKRKLLTNYLIHKGIKGKTLSKNYNLYLNEEIRPNDNYPIFEDDYGTHIFRSKKLISYDILDSLNSLVDTFFIERLFLTDEEYYDSIKLYLNTISLTKYLSLYSHFDSGFYYKRTEKIKGEIYEN